MTETKIGSIIHYWGKIGVAGLRLTAGELKVGDTIRIKGHTSDFTQTVDSMQVEGDAVEVARAGDDVGIKVGEVAREHDEVFVVSEEPPRGG